jgi:predicted DNA-binding transcriptional regulator AlpA
MNENRVLSRGETAKKMIISVNTLRNVVKNGKLKQVKLSARRVGYLESDVNTYLANGGIQ